MKVVDEEIFGPVVCAIPFDELDEVATQMNSILDAAVSQLILGILRQGQPGQDAQAGKHCHSSEHGRYAIMIGKPPGDEKYSRCH
jgi:acyl-CoA reductase-like NAD-dependent aldehyde dehydrogenase